jgi:shikimate dehydrogenase
VSVWNRTRERARSLAEDLGVRFAEHAEPADLLVNCTAVGLHAESSEEEALALLGLDDGKLGDYGYVADLAYRDGETELLAAAARHGARTLDGLDVLVAQGALSFELWTGRAAPLEVMRRAVRGGAVEA